jgi:hypothetical protein
MRLSKPDLKVEQQIHQAGLGLINIFGEDLFDFIDNSLKTKLGTRWLLDLQKTDYRYQSGNFKDPSNLLKDIIRNSSSPLRGPLREVIPQKESVAFYSRLQVVLDDRNEWVHHQINATEESLKILALNISPIAKKLDLATINECDFLIDLISLGVAVPFDSTDELPLLKEVADLNPGVVTPIVSEEDWRIGDRVDEGFLDHSYTLLLSGSVKDRKTGKLLEEANRSHGSRVSKLLLERKPSGGRLRITPGGIIAGYFEEHWGYIAQIQSGEWFPSHLDEKPIS